MPRFLAEWRCAAGRTPACAKGWRRPSRDWRSAGRPPEEPRDRARPRLARLDQGRESGDLFRAGTALPFRRRQQRPPHLALSPSPPAAMSASARSRIAGEPRHRRRHDPAFYDIWLKRRGLPPLRLHCEDRITRLASGALLSKGSSSTASACRSAASRTHLIPDAGRGPSPRLP